MQMVTEAPFMDELSMDVTAINATQTTNASSSNDSRVTYYIDAGNYETPILVHIFISVYVIFGIIIAVFNTFTIVAIVKCPELKTVTNMFVLSLSCADLILSPTLIFIHFLQDVALTLGLSWARVLAFCLLSLMFTSSGTSLLSILAIAVDRYIAVIHPYSYKQIMTHRRAIVVIVIIWLYVTSFMTSLIAYFLWKTHSSNFLHVSMISYIIPFPVYAGAVVSQILICIIASVALYVKIFVAIRRRHQASLSLRGRNPQTETRESRRITNTMAMVLGALIISWIPYALYSIVVTDNFIRRHNWIIYVSMFSILLLYANSFMNPIIYAARSNAFRRAYWKMMCCSCVNNPGSPEYFHVDTPTTVSVKSTKESITEAPTQNGRSDTTEI